MVNVRQNLVNSSKYNIKCPHEMNAEFIVVHNTANDASANNEIAYMVSNNNKVSYHYAVDDVEIIQGIPENRNAWHAGDGGNGEGNRKGLAIEICYSKSGGDRFDKAEKNAAEFIASKLKEKGWGIDKVKKHKDFANKYCPHRTLDYGWDRFLDMVRCYMGETVTTPPQESGLPNLSGYSGDSIVDALNSVGYNSSYASRKDLATKLGIVNYKGTAEQNLQMLSILKGNSNVSTSYYKQCSSGYTSLVDALRSIGVDSSYANRKNIAIRNGISNYKGTASQNVELLNKLKNGCLVK
ncbi:MAG TPA: N-acetylmuramoyl-L-alanine amidase [Candidatus Merdicola faecigallinarum]|uniref:N-acetylmuramoyl-L-alanine amidase n=1 Tax=Candidatus Merdicola faecigallinarum TaxID=2840862 RepID=A0A9D1S9F1_9FIRM|nr:N-acetylmuramoyl-L-alanine amidase [Candidatus Merdicola faecigallinarum]